MSNNANFGGQPGYPAGYPMPGYAPGQVPPGYIAPEQVPPGYVPAGYVPLESDAPSAGFAVLSFFVPTVGLILWLVWRDRTPQKANSAGKGALAGVIFWVVMSILFVVVYVHIMVGLVTGVR